MSSITFAFAVVIILLCVSTPLCQENSSVLEYLPMHEYRVLHYSNSDACKAAPIWPSYVRYRDYLERGLNLYGIIADPLTKDISALAGEYVYARYHVRTKSTINVGKDELAENERKVLAEHARNKYSANLDRYELIKEYEDGTVDVLMVCERAVNISIYRFENIGMIKRKCEKAKVLSLVDKREGIYQTNEGQTMYAMYALGELLLMASDPGVLEEIDEVVNGDGNNIFTSQYYYRINEMIPELGQVWTVMFYGRYESDDEQSEEDAEVKSNFNTPALRMVTYELGQDIESRGVSIYANEEGARLGVSELKQLYSSDNVKELKGVTRKLVDQIIDTIEFRADRETAIVKFQLDRKFFRDMKKIYDESDSENEELREKEAK